MIRLQFTATHSKYRNKHSSKPNNKYSNKHHIKPQHTSATNTETRAAENTATYTESTLTNTVKHQQQMQQQTSATSVTNTATNINGAEASEGDRDVDGSRRRDDDMEEIRQTDRGQVVDNLESKQNFKLNSELHREPM